jgi:hypothetical protein
LGKAKALFQLTSGEILTGQELLAAIEEGKVAGLTARQTDDGVELTSDEDDETLDLISPISEDDLQAYYQRTDRATDGVDLHGFEHDAMV